MTTEDRTFYRRRMREELEKAMATSDPALRHLHPRWANLYERRLEGRHIGMSDAIDEAVGVLG